MKLLIASDIHGSAEFCRQLINAVERVETFRRNSNNLNWFI